MRLARKIPFFWKAHGIVPGWSPTTNLSSFRNRTRYLLRHGENVRSFSTKNPFFILLYTVYSLLFWIDNIVKKGDDTRVPTLPIDAR